MTMLTDLQLMTGTERNIKYHSLKVSNRKGSGSWGVGSFVLPLWEWQPNADSRTRNHPSVQGTPWNRWAQNRGLAGCSTCCLSLRHTPALLPASKAQPFGGQNRGDVSPRPGTNHWSHCHRSTVLTNWPHPPPPKTLGPTITKPHYYSLHSSAGSSWVSQTQSTCLGRSFPSAIL